MLKLLRWPAVIMLLAILFISPFAVSGLAMITWLAGRAAVNHSTPVRLFVTGIMALAGSLFLQLAVSPFNTLTMLCFIITLTVVAARVFNPPFQRKAAAHYHPGPVIFNEDGSIEAEVISEKTIER